MKILICIAFHFSQNQLQYLQKVLQSYVDFSVELEIFIMTNTINYVEINQIQSIFPTALSGQMIQIISFVDLVNPWLLTWGHKQIMRERFDGHGFTHFIYAECDIEITRSNLQYWLIEREVLRGYRFNPGFVMLEWSELSSSWVSTSARSTVQESILPRLKVDYREYINLGAPYQGCFLYDRELMAEHMASTTFDMNIYGNILGNNLEWGGGMAENANFALTFVDVPSGFISRNIVRYYGKYKMLDPQSFIHHLPNKYAINPDTPHSKVPITQLFT